MIIKNRKIINQFSVGFGDNPDGKAKSHDRDRRTPEGLYTITGILSMAADRKSNAFQLLDKMNKMHLRAKDGHHLYANPQMDSGTNTYGPRLFWLSYPNISDKGKYAQYLKENKIPRDKSNLLLSIGGGIAIHGTNDPEAVGNPSTPGCIILNNEDIIKLEKYIRIGTPVLISNMELVDAK